MSDAPELAELVLASTIARRPYERKRILNGIERGDIMWAAVLDRSKRRYFLTPAEARRVRAWLDATPKAGWTR